ncbi:MAG: hypothetical protein IKN65_07465 [Clostridia bacterium]|nr:hypothetical protein [Clostridia bacterium]
MLQQTIVCYKDQSEGNGITGNLAGINGNVMSVGGGVGDQAVDVTYSTKPDSQNVTLGRANSINSNIRLSNELDLASLNNTGNLNSTFYSNKTYKVSNAFVRPSLYSSLSYNYRKSRNFG